MKYTQYNYDTSFDETKPVQLFEKKEEKVIIEEEGIDGMAHCLPLETWEQIIDATVAIAAKAE